MIAVNWDREHDLAYIGDDVMRRRVKHSVRRVTEIVLDFDEHKQLLGIELLNASSCLEVDP